jgi:glycerol-3-phosphate dehydrogenase
MRATTDMGEAADAGYAVHAVPVQHSRAFLEGIRDVLPPSVPIVCVSKGLEVGTGCMMSEVIPSALGRRQPATFISGPSFAREVMEGRPTGVVAACRDAKLARQVQALFASPSMRVNTSTDVVGERARAHACSALERARAPRPVLRCFLARPQRRGWPGAGVPSGLRRSASSSAPALPALHTHGCPHQTRGAGVEICGALKNVLAIAAGIVEGLDLGHNALAALVAQGCAEIRWLAEKLGAKPQTMSGLSGLGDIMLTCYGDLSRNRSVGMRLGRGERLEDILASSSQVGGGVWRREGGGAHSAARRGTWPAQGCGCVQGLSAGSPCGL